MKSSLILSQLALVASVVALLMVWGEDSPREDWKPLSPASSVDAEALARLDERVALLTRENRDLSERLEALELRPVLSARSPVASGGSSEEELEAIRGEVRAELERRGELPPLIADDPNSLEFTSRVSDAMSEIKIREAREGAQRGAEKRAARLREKLTGVSEQLGLNGSQEASLEAALVTFYETQANYRVMWATGEVEAKEDFGEIYQGDLDLFLTEVSGYLTPQQYDDYMNLPSGDLFPGGNNSRK